RGEGCDPEAIHPSRSYRNRFPGVGGEVIPGRYYPYFTAVRCVRATFPRDLKTRLRCISIQGVGP
ncbi:MAG: hypothetical protein PHD01_19005, partial [Geobacteraceae bacterium]|nr:hypothetical protein [Geobacteraceae bacterium]